MRLVLDAGSVAAALTAMAGLIWALARAFTRAVESVVDHKLEGVTVQLRTIADRLRQIEGNQHHGT
jgi:demethoxyubiquinone hydroxylase (CLK1/Coq7/Cat5 family)